MSNKTNGGSKPAITPDTVNENIYLESIGRPTDMPIDRKQAFALMKEAGNEYLEDLNGGEYFQMDAHSKGTVFVWLFKGLTGWKSKQGQDVKAIKFEDENGQEFVFAAAQLYNACEKLKQIPCFIKVTYNGMEKTDKGKMYDLKVQAFKMPNAPATKNDLPFD